MSSDKPSCFVIMPFSVRDHDLEKYNGDANHWNEVYEGLIEPAVEAAGMRAVRDDNDLSSRLIAEGIWRKIEDSNVVLCDLSSFNPNVYLELGWALRADKKFVLIKDELTDFSFDLNQLHTCNYNSMLRPISLKSDIQKLCNTILNTDADKGRQYSLVKRLALTTAIELDAGSDKQADMLELIYTKLEHIGNQNTWNNSKSDLLQVTNKSYGLESLPKYFREGSKVELTNTAAVIESLHLLDHFPWPSAVIRKHCAPDMWKGWSPTQGENGRVLYSSNWNSDEYEGNVMIVQFGLNYVPIASSGLTLID